jgi:subtilase family serine protease
VTDFTLTGDFTVQYEITAPVNICLPDLRTDVVLNESQIFTGESTGGSVTVTNIGCAATEISTLLDLYQTGGLPLIGDETVPPLQPGESVQFEIEEITFDTPGTYSVCGLADAEYLIEEASESNNTDCASVNVIPPFPDIVPIAGPVGSQFLCLNNPNPSFVIRNAGGVETGFFEYTIAVFLEGAFQASFTQELDNIAPFSNASVSIPFSLDQLGVYTFNIECDIPLPGGIVVESNEDNNTNNFAKEVRECQPDLRVLECGQLEVEPIDPEIPGDVTYIARVRNMGNATAAQPIEFEFTVSNGELYQVIITEDIAPNETVEVSTSAPSVESGEELLTATADPGDLISEFNEFNNSYSDSLCWEFSPVPKCGSNWWNATYSPNQTVVVSVGLDVDYLYAASEAVVRFEVEGPGIAGTALLGDVGVVDATQTCNCPYVVTLPSSFIFTELGTYTFTFTADPDGIYDECDETNNVLQVEVEVTDLADLRILSQFINPTVLNPALGESVFFDITYENIGVSNPEDEMNLRVLVDEVELGIFENVTGLISGQNTTIAFPVPYSTEIGGAHIVRAIIDSDDEIEEANELNNEATRAIVVGEAANLFFDVFMPDDGSPNIGQPIAIDAVIGNNGSIDVSADVIFSYVTNLGDTVQIGSIPVDVMVDGSQAISLPWNVQDNNTTLLGEIVNASEIEFNYDDNFASAELGAFDITITTIAFCEGENGGSLMASAEGGNPPYTFSWSNGFIGETLEAEPGTYTVTVTDDEGFEATASGTIGIDETCVEPVCDINAISFTVDDNCDPVTGLFDVSLTVSYENQPDIGFISVNGQDFGISGSPQTFDFEIAEGAVNFDVSFTENEDCSLFIMTGVIITPCEEDCEGIFGGDALPGEPCVIGGSNGIYNDNCECIPQVECLLIVNSFDITDNCDPATGLYTAFVELSYANAPFDGVLVVNEEEFEITQSPQTISLDLVEGPVVFEAFFSEDPSCNTILDTGIDLEACEEDCEGVFGGTALPGTECQLAGAVGVYNFDCECIPNVGCTADGGTISTDGPMAVCKGDGVPDPIFVDLEGAVGENSIWLVTSSNGLIVDITDENIFDFEETIGTGICVIWHLSWDGEIFGLEVGANAFDLEGDCFDLSNPLEIFEVYVNGGEISVDGETTFCTDDGEADIVQVTVTGNAGPNGRFLVTDADLNVLQISQTGEFDFEGAGEGLCLIWYASYAGPITLPESGTNVADIEGCFSLSNSIEIGKEECDDPIIADCDNWRYFLSDNKTNGTSDIYQVVLDDETDQAQMTLFKSLEYPVHIAYNESGDELYLVRSSSGSFRTLDVSVADGALSAEIPLDISLSGVVTTTFDASGNFYIGAESAQTIYEVNTATGVTAEYADASIAGGDIAFGTDGELYHVTRDNGGRAIKINLEGENEDLGSVPDLVTGLAARNDGNLMISTKDRSRLYVGDTDAMYLNKFYTLVLENEVFTMSNGDMASGCADNEPNLQSCNAQTYYYANHGNGINGTDIYEVLFSETEAELMPLLNLPYQAHIAQEPEQSGLLYFVNANGDFLEIYDIATTAITQVEVTGNINKLFAVVLNSADGLLYVGDDDDNAVYTVHPITGETNFFADAPINGGDLAIADGDIYLAKRDSDDLFKFIEGSFVDIGSLPDEVNGMCATEMLNELIVASGESSTFSRISSSNGGLIAEYTAILDGEVFTLSNGDMSSGCTDPDLEPQCMYQLFYAHNGSDGINALLSLTADGEGGFDTEELAMNIGDAHIGVLPNGNELFVVDGSGSFRIFDLSSQTFGEEVNIAAADGNITGTPAAVSTPDGFLIVASSNRNHAYLVNPETGFASEVGREIPVNGGDLVFDSNGTLWYINRNSGTFYDVYGEDEFSVPLGDINGAALLDDGTILLAEGDEGNIMYGCDVESQALNGEEYTVPLNLFWGDLAGQCLNIAYITEQSDEVAETPKGWIRGYPNPNDGTATVTFKTATDGEAIVEIFDMSGRKVDQVYSGNVDSTRDYQVEVMRPDLPDGIYIYRLTKADETMIGKFIISK